MSSRFTINRMEFHSRKDGEIYYGFTAYDDYNQMYDDSLTKEEFELEGLDFLKLIFENNHNDTEIFSAMMDFVIENQHRICIDGKMFDWEEIKDIVSVSGYSTEEEDKYQGNI